MTWNVWGRFGPWLPRREAIAATLADVGPDLCGLQEVWSAGEQNLAADLAERLGMYWRWEMAACTRTERDEVCIGNAILSRWPIIANAEVSLPTAGTDEGRVAVHARVETPGGSLPMFTTHLTHHPGASQIRLAQVRRLAEFVATHAADCAYPPVVTGDLNAEPASDELRLLGGLLTPGGTGAGTGRRLALRGPGGPRIHLGPQQRLSNREPDPRLPNRLHPGRAAQAGPRPRAVYTTGWQRPGRRRVAVGSFRSRSRSAELDRRASAPCARAAVPQHRVGPALSQPPADRERAHLPRGPETSEGRVPRGALDEVVQCGRSWPGCLSR
ncbi:MAG TPA: endonuclease/exonuclease/phosphatase family protein [Streptosporangiaceae bacterium]|nr:endonuclease/exonuclease/phosphatase family protein [Streptosporangiaceae bacterium]